ncbi:MFS transporter [Bacillus sp. AGMB 02131]|uniref:MFS transporter n=1 Tax=Peribacillus faecalis TaxID=2772559 RepID=A0A927HCG7_9BACI|nr:MDR family MFS transporter [Peribacillus faecalis]MBD3109536.1 MFS transporter [Peribacillus faecalis]
MVAEKSNNKLLITGILLSILVAAMDNTIVATAMGTIVGDLGDLDKFVWVTAAYMVASMAAMPIFGKLSDMFGRKRFFIFGLLVFLIGSALCGLAQSMVQLSIFRAIQGIGGGALMPIAFTIVFDVFPPEKRGKMIGLVGATFGISSVFGPLIGAYITEYISWHWIFYVNVPIGIISLLFVMTSYKESANRLKQSIDWGGAITLVASVVCFMFAIELGGKQYEWTSAPIIALFSIFAIMFVSFLFIETKAKDPIISFSLFKKPLFASSQVLAFIYGATFIPLTVYIPIFVQSVFGGSATNAGLILTPMMLGSVVGSGISGMTQTKTSFRNLMFISVVSFAAGLLLLSTMTPDTSRVLVTLFMVLSGIGVGFSFSLLPTSSIHNLEATQRGSANSTNAFFRTLGMTIGITIFGSIQSSRLTDYLTEAFAGKQAAMNFLGNQDLSGIFTSEVRSQIPPEILNTIINGMSESITDIFRITFFVLLFAFIFVFMMGNEKVEIPQKEKE